MFSDYHKIIGCVHLSLCLNVVVISKFAQKSENNIENEVWNYMSPFLYKLKYI